MFADLFQNTYIYNLFANCSSKSVEFEDFQTTILQQNVFFKYEGMLYRYNRNL